jgi:hypothetical protein
VCPRQEQQQTKWTEHLIAHALAYQLFNRQHLIVVPNCNWTGNECDLLVITRDLRVIDIEIKISKSDLKADIKKDKWYHRWDWRIDGAWHGRRDKHNRRRREWPEHAWKHYYAMPESVWDMSMSAILPKNSGIILLCDRNRIKLIRRAKPCRDAKKISAEDAINIARLSSLRMWNAYEELRKLKGE